MTLFKLVFIDKITYQFSLYQDRFPTLRQYYKKNIKSKHDFRNKN